MYIVTGGIHTDTTFNTIEPGTEESYGLFARYDEARAVWFSKTMRNVDVCEHRLFITDLYPD